jgi:hypothetical protein
MPFHCDAASLLCRWLGTVNTNRYGYSDVMICNKQQIAAKRNFDARGEIFNCLLTF